ncbi:MAG: hypothetical protein ACPG5Y_01975, partial [Pseudomonadales bacterium]
TDNKKSTPDVSPTLRAGGGGKSGLGRIKHFYHPVGLKTFYWLVIDVNQQPQRPLMGYIL